MVYQRDMIKDEFPYYYSPMVCHGYE